MFIISKGYKNDSNFKVFMVIHENCYQHLSVQPILQYALRRTDLRVFHVRSRNPARSFTFTPSPHICEFHFSDQARASCNHSLK